MTTRNSFQPFIHYTLVLPLFNEAKRLHHFKSTFSFLRYVRVIDAGSTDNTLNILKSWGHPGLDIITIVNRDSKPRDPEWYQKTLHNLPTKYFLFGNAGHCYTFQLLQELEAICSDLKPDIVEIQNHHHFMGSIDSTFGSYIPKYAPAQIFKFLSNSKSIRSGELLHLDVIDWSQYRLHNELPIRRNFDPKIISSKYPIYSFRDETSESLEIKHSGYATSHAQDSLSLGLMQSSPKKITQLSMFVAYFGHFFHCWLYKGSIFQGVKGLISAHYWASYHFSVKVRAYEIINGLSADRLINLNNTLRSKLSNF